MKNETARREIESLDYYLQNHTDDYSEESHTAMMMGIKALEQESCEDAISREEALMCLTGEIKDTDTIETIIARFVRRIRKLSSVNPQPKTGHWIDEGIYADGQNYHAFMCSECEWHYIGNKSELVDFKYCPFCRAKMQEAAEGSDKE